MALAGATLATHAGQPTSMKDAKRVLPDVMRPARVVMPTTEQAAEPVSPGLTEGRRWDDGSEPASLPEGTFLIERIGRIIPAPGQRRVFVPDTDQREPGEGPMLLLPSAALERLELTLADSTGPVRVSGVVYVYRNRRHLLVASFLMGAGMAPTELPEPEESTEDATGQDEPNEPDTSMLDDPEVRGLLDELEAEAPPPVRRNPDARSQPAETPDPSASASPPAPDGTPIVRRQGRLSRSANGTWLFVFDNDTDDRLASQALTVLPCQLLERIEREAQTRGDAAQMILSGRVYTHQGTAYLLPTMMLRARPVDIVPMR